MKRECKNDLKYKCVPKKGRTKALFFLDLESSGVWAGYWHYLKKLQANSIYGSYIPLRIQENSLYLLTVAGKFFSILNIRPFVWNYSAFFSCKNLKIAD